MCKVMEERVKDEKYQEKIFIAVNLLKLGTIAREETANVTGLSLETGNDVCYNQSVVRAID
ncbi:MAG: hypothetical protein IJ861_00280 [Clostridia bacterium]|nr:hypothetical protein [Clostridia bacterium]